MAIKINQLEAFVRVADLGSFRRAAASLNTTQPNISNRLARLEARLGKTLMDRDAGSVRLTPVGGELLEKARRVLNAADEFLDAADELELLEGTLRLGVTEMIVHSWLDDLVAELSHRFPNIVAEINVDLSTNLSDALTNRSIDLALQSGPFVQETSGNVDLGHYPMAWVAVPEIAGSEPTLSAAMLSQHPVITHTRKATAFKQTEQHFSKTLPGTVRYMTSTSMSACLRMTVKGLGIACLPRVMVIDDINNGTLTHLTYDWTPDGLTFAARFDRLRAPLHVIQATEIAEVISGRHSG